MESLATGRRFIYHSLLQYLSKLHLCFLSSRRLGLALIISYPSASTPLSALNAVRAAASVVAKELAQPRLPLELSGSGKCILVVRRMYVYMARASSKDRRSKFG